jgi:hypothetical protein
MLPVKIASVGFAPNVVNAGQSSTATVTLTGAAPAGGAVVTLSSVALNAAGGQLPGVSVANVPASVTVPAGQTSASFAVSQTSVPGNAATATLRMTAAYAGSSLVQDLTINRPVTVTGLSFSPSSVLGGATGFSTGTVTLSGQAPANGATVTLANNNAGVATVPQSVIVAAGKTSQTFSVTTAALPTNAAAVSVQVTASFGGATAPAILTVIAQRLG